MNLGEKVDKIEKEGARGEAVLYMIRLEEPKEGAIRKPIYLLSLLSYLPFLSSQCYRRHK